MYCSTTHLFLMDGKKGFAPIFLFFIIFRSYCQLIGPITNLKACICHNNYAQMVKMGCATLF